MPAQRENYTAVAIVLHWAIAAAIIGNFGLGLWMHEAIEGDTQALAIAGFQLHKSIGLTVLALSLLRLLWRWLNPPPPLPESMARWEKRAARLTHWAFYFLMLAIPLSGWLYVSVQWRGDAALNLPTLWFGLYEVPHILDLHRTSDANRELLAGPLSEAHEVLAFAAAGLLALHIGAALKHQFIDRDEVTGRILPMLAKQPVPGSGRRFTLYLGTGLIMAACIAAPLSLLLSTGSGPTSKKRIETADTSLWLVDPQASEIRYTGVNAGEPFEGVFSHWQADIRFDPDRPDQSSITASIYTASASNGVAIQDETLPQDEWFDVSNHPTAIVRSTAISPAGDGQYRVSGVLTIKGQDVALEDFLLTVDADLLHIEGQTTINRRDINMGMISDPRGQWVSLNIPVSLRLLARRR